MIHHHQMALGMAKEAATKAEHPEIKEMARKTVVKQTAEIAEMSWPKGRSAAKTSKVRATANQNQNPRRLTPFTKATLRWGRRGIWGNLLDPAQEC